MARANLIAKEDHKDKAIKRFEIKRDALKAILNCQSASCKEKQSTVQNPVFA